MKSSLNNRNIAIIGGMGSGKTTICNLIAEKYGKTVYSFATEVKNLFVMIYARPIDKGIDRTELQDIGEFLKIPYDDLTQQQKEKIDSWLKISNKFRQYYMANASIIHKKDFYIKKNQQREGFREAILKGKVAIDDTRFFHEEEFEHLPENDFFLVKLSVPLEIRIARLKARDKNFKEEWLQNSSESQWDKLKCDMIVLDAHLSTPEEIIEQIERSI